MDPFHVVILHGTFSGTQFVDAMAVMPEVTFAAFVHAPCRSQYTGRAALPAEPFVPPWKPNAPGCVKRLIAMPVKGSMYTLVWSLQSMVGQP